MIISQFYDRDKHKLFLNAHFKRINMVRTNEEYLSNSLTYVYKPEIGQRVEYTANTGTTIMTAGNSNMNGTGTLYNVIASGSSGYGTLIKTITLKGTKTTTRGMVRLYLHDGSTTSIIAEIEIPAISQDGIQRTYEISYEVDFMLTDNWSMQASIENGSEDMVVIAQGLNVTFP